MSVDLHPSTDRTVIADNQMARAIEHSKRANPCVFAHLYISQNERTIVNATSLAKAQILSLAPSINNVVCKWETPIPLLLPGELLLR